MQLRVNRKKKEVFEAEAPRSAKRLKTNNSTPARILSRPVNNHVGQTSHASPSKQSFTTASSQSRIPLDNHNIVNTTSKSGPTLENRPDLAEGADPNRTATLTASSVPSLATDFDTSDDSLSSPSDKQLCSSDILAGRSLIQKNGGLDIGVLAHPINPSTGFDVGVVHPEPGPQSYYSLHRAGYNGRPTNDGDILTQARQVLEEMQTGQYSKSSHHENLGQPLNPSRLFPQEPFSSNASDSRHVPDSLPTTPPEPDTAIATVLQGIISELATGLNHGHGIAYLLPHVARHQFVERQRFIESLTALMTKALPKVNSFVSAYDAANLKSIFRCFENRLPAAELPPPTPPPGHMVVMHSIPAYPFHNVAHDFISSSAVNADSPIIMSPIIKVAPKRRKKSAS